MLWLKSCPRCRGDMMEERMLGELELVCLQCGHRSYPQPAAVRLTARPAPGPRALVKAA